MRFRSMNRGGGKWVSEFNERFWKNTDSRVAKIGLYMLYTHLPQTFGLNITVKNHSKHYSWSNEPSGFTLPQDFVEISLKRPQTSSKIHPSPRGVCFWINCRIGTVFVWSMLNVKNNNKHTYFNAKQCKICTISDNRIRWATKNQPNENMPKAC